MKLYPREVFVWTAAAIRQSTAPTRSKKNSPIASTASRDRSVELLATHIRTCVADGIRQGDDAVIDELVTTLQKLMK